MQINIKIECACGKILMNSPIEVREDTLNAHIYLDEACPRCIEAYMNDSCGNCDRGVCEDCDRPICDDCDLKTKFEIKLKEESARNLDLAYNRIKEAE